MPDYNAEFRKGRMAFFKKYAISPPDDTSENPFSNPRVIQGGEEGYRQIAVLKKKRIGYINFVDMPRDKIGALTFTISFQDTDHNLIPVWFLPWKSEHLTEIQIDPTDALNDDEERVNPSIFFTAALSGCSVFVQGSPRKPRVFHGGITGKPPRPASQFWWDLMEAKLKVEGFNPKRNQTVYELNKSQYIKDELGMQPQIVTNYEKWLKTQRREYTLDFVSPWASVFGIRYGSLWSFYAQQNVQEITYKMVKMPKTITKNKRVFLFFQKKVTVETEVDSKISKNQTRVVTITPLFPKGPTIYRCFPET